MEQDYYSIYYMILQGIIIMSHRDSEISVLHALSH